MPTPPVAASNFSPTYYAAQLTRSYSRTCNTLDEACLSLSWPGQDVFLGRLYFTSFFIHRPFWDILLRSDSLFFAVIPSSVSDVALRGVVSRGVGESGGVVAWGVLSAGCLLHPLRREFRFGEDIFVTLHLRISWIIRWVSGTCGACWMLFRRHPFFRVQLL